MGFDSEKVKGALERRDVNQPCPRCGNKGFALADGYFNHSIQKELSAGLVIGGQSIPTVVTICNRCGYLSQHAAGVLGLIEKLGGSK